MISGSDLSNRMVVCLETPICPTGQNCPEIGADILQENAVQTLQVLIAYKMEHMKSVSTGCGDPAVDLVDFRQS